MKRLLTLTAFLMLTVVSFAYDAKIDGIYYDFSGNEATVTFYSYPHNETAYTGNIVIPSTVTTYSGKTYSVTSIGNSAFYDCSGITSVTIPESVTSIGWNAFRFCTGLTSVTIPESVTSIGSSAFSGCSGLTSIKVESGNTTYDSRDNCNAIIETVSNTLITGCNNTTIPHSVTSIGSEAFYDSGIASVTIPSNVMSIGEQAFSFCSSLNSIKVESGNTKYDSRDNCNAIIETASNTLIAGCKNTIIPNSVTSIGSSAFYGCRGLTSITIPNSVTSIGSGAFEGCKTLTSVTISNGVTSIGDEAFRGCSGLTSVTIPESVTSIGRYSFGWCSGLTSVTIGNSVTSIDDCAFTCCESLTSISIPNSVTSIGEYVFNDTPWFKNQLEGVVYAGKVACGYNGTMPLNASIVLKEGTVGISENAFRGCGPLTSVTIPNSVVTIGESAFYGTNSSIKFYVDKDAITLLHLWNYYIGKSGYGKDHIYDINTGKKVEIFETTASSVKVFDITPKNYKINSYTLKIKGKNTELPYYVKGMAPNTSVGEIILNIDYQDSRGEKYTFSESAKVSTAPLTLKTEQPKVVSSGNVVVAATTNVDENEENVGFEWRRDDWTEDFASKTGQGKIYDGTMEGYIQNLNTEKLWRYRAYYLSDAGTYYYGDWVGIDPTDVSYFEPTVHTYADISTEGRTALVKGYALAGTDKITVQGFKYWKSVSKANSLGFETNGVTAVPSDAKTVEATGQVMNASLAGLDYDSEYTIVAFVTTSENETFYGEERTFTTEANPTGIEAVEADESASAEVTVVAVYDANARRIAKPQRGLNILRMSDGTSRKIVVQ